MATSIPTVKVEGDHNVKMEDVSSPSAASDQYMDEIDAPALAFDDVHKQLWMSRIPKYLWETLAKLGDDDEIELGTVRVEGNIQNPERVSLMLHDKPVFRELEKEYVLKRQTGPVRRSKRPNQVLMFSEKDRPGFKPRANFWDDMDENGNPGQGRSQLYEQALKDDKKKENKGKFIPYERKPIPKLTALAGTVVHEFEIEPVDNAEHRRIENQRTTSILKEKPKEATLITEKTDLKNQFGSIVTAAERQNIVRSAQNRRTAAKEARNARDEKPILQIKMFELFREHRFWGLRDLRIRLRQPEQWVKENLEDIAIMHRQGDFNGKWELKDSFKADEGLQNAVGEAPKLEDDSDVDMKSEGDEDDFEDV